MIPRNNLTSISPLDVLQGKNFPSGAVLISGLLRIHIASKLLASLIPMIADNLLIIINLYSRRQGPDKGEGSWAGRHRTISSESVIRVES